MAGMHAESLSDDELWSRALDCFRNCDWWLAHEWFEELWKRHPNGESGTLFQGLLQAAVCLHHYGNGNFAGARQMAKRATALLDALPDDAQGLPMAPFRVRFATCVAALLNPGENLKPLAPADVPQL